MPQPEAPPETKRSERGQVLGDELLRGHTSGGLGRRDGREGCSGAERLCPTGMRGGRLSGELGLPDQAGNTGCGTELKLILNSSETH